MYNIHWTMERGIQTPYDSSPTPVCYSATPQFVNWNISFWHIGPSYIWKMLVHVKRVMWINKNEPTLESFFSSLEVGANGESVAFISECSWGTAPDHCPSASFGHIPKPKMFSCWEPKPRVLLDFRLEAVFSPIHKYSPHLHYHLVL